MKGLDLVTGNFCCITNIQFTNVHKQASWDSQFKLLIYIQVYSNRRMREIEINTSKNLSRKSFITFFSILDFVSFCQNKLFHFFPMTASWDVWSCSPNIPSIVMFNLWQLFLQKISFISFSSSACSRSYSLQFKRKCSGVSFTLQMEHSGEVSALILLFQCQFCFSQIALIVKLYFLTAQNLQLFG